MRKKRIRGTSGDGSGGGTDILVAGEEAKVDLVVVDQRKTYNASCRVPVCMGCSLVLLSSEKTKLTEY